MGDTVEGRLRMAREQMGKTRSEMSDVLGININTYTMLERGLRSMTPKHLTNICSKTNVCREWLEHGTGPMFRKSKDEELYDLIMSMNEDDKAFMITLMRKISREHSEPA